MDSFNLIDIVILIGICQGIFLSLTLHRITNNNKKANAILSVLLLIATCMLIGRFLYFRFLTQWVFEWSLWVDALVFLFGPLFYIYTRRLLFSENSQFRLAKYHYIPFVAMILLSLGIVVLYSPEAYYQLFLDGQLNLMFDSILLMGIVLNSYYLVRSFLLLRTFKNLEHRRFSFDQSAITYIRFFLLSIGAFLLAWLVSFINASLFERYFSFVNYDSVWVVIPVFIYVIGYFSLKQPELFRIPLEKNQKERKDRLSESDSNILKSKLDSLMLNEKLFLQSNLTLRDVAETLQTSTNNISWLLNTVYKTTFYDFINGHRIQEFVHKVENKEHLRHTILALSMDVGFNSKSTFNKAFKFTMNDTPRNYIKSVSAA